MAGRPNAGLAQAWIQLVILAGVWGQLGPPGYPDRPGARAPACLASPAGNGGPGWPPPGHPWNKSLPQ
jgi:hypothetical protein